MLNYSLTLPDFRIFWTDRDLIWEEEKKKGVGIECCNPRHVTVKKKNFHNWILKQYLLEGFHITFQEDSSFLFGSVWIPPSADAAVILVTMVNGCGLITDPHCPLHHLMDRQLYTFSNICFRPTATGIQYTDTISMHSSLCHIKI